MYHYHYISNEHDSAIHRKTACLHGDALTGRIFLKY